MTANSPVKLRCVLLGEQSLMVECGERLRAQGHAVLAVVTQSARLRGWAGEHALPVFDDHEALLHHGPAEFDLLLNITWLRMLPTALISRPQIAAINFHDGPLPRYAGLNAPAWALLRGETKHGVSWHRMAERADAGELLVQEHFEIAPGSSAFELNARCYEAGLVSFERLLQQIETGTLAPLPQDFGTRSYFSAKARPDNAALLDFSQPAASLQALVRALDFGPYPNPLLLPRLRLSERDVLVRAAEAVKAETGTAGAVLELDAHSLLLRCGEGALRIAALSELDGSRLPVQQLGLQRGQHLPTAFDTDGAELKRCVRAAAAAEPALLSALHALQPLALPFAERAAAAPTVSHTGAAQALRIELGSLGPQGLAVALLAIARCANVETLDLALQPRSADARSAATARVVTPLLPLQLQPDWSAPFERWQAQIEAALDAADTATGLLSDLRARQPGLAAALWPEQLSLRLLRVPTLPAASEPAAAPLSLYLDDAGALCLLADGLRYPADALQRLHRVIETLLQRQPSPRTPIGELPLLYARGQDELLTWTAPPASADDPDSALRAASVQALIAAQVKRSPQREALCFEGQRLSYAELDAGAETLAQRLAGAGVKHRDRVGLLLQRGPALITALLATLKAGAAYVPLDPLYPPPRLAYMAADAELALLLTDADSAHLIEHPNTLRIDADSAHGALLTTPADPDALAYLIYTSGSTGQPKGVSISHRNVLNFFAGMDALIQPRTAAEDEAPGSWLAVTSISFDISVLELLWTLARGYRVVLYADPRRQQAARLASKPEHSTPIEFGLFFWNVAGEQDINARDKYRLLLESARFADTHDFNAVWTPERHFAAFGGLYPNPAVTSAALATITERVALRAGSCVVPLHHPIRIAEEWAVVDNLSNGRVGVSIAAGWAAPDFVLKPENHAESKRLMFEFADQVQRLWRGETLNFPGPKGEVAVRTLPRPIQAELPLWVTAAGNPETFAEAGRIGANLLTHLLGQTVEEVAEKIRVYRAAHSAAGHAGRGTVTLMLHSFIGDSREAVEAQVRGPMKDYLRSAMALVKAAAWHFPTFKQQMSEAQGKNLDAFFADASDTDLDALLEFAFLRYFNESGLFGSAEDALTMVERVAEADIDEIACLIDFGIDAQTVLDQLPALDRVRALSAERGITALGRRADHSLPALLARERISHLQCTPSMAAMLAQDPACAAGLSGLKQLLLGGEALPPALLQRLKSLGVGRISNVYGPTETTVWSAADTDCSGAESSSTPIGRPLPGQSLYILDARQQLLPQGLVGEIVIGGAGVSRGYWRREDLSAERFLADPFSTETDARMYRSGDLGRLRSDGRFECLGRVDSQVKIRGYRVELGEIEARLGALPGIVEAAVLLREDTPGDQRLVGYVRAPGLDANALDQRLATLAVELPEFMRPSLLLNLHELPRTPNGKLDRRALSAPGLRKIERTEPSAPASEVEKTVAALWANALGVESVGTRDNFFDLGGHSLLVVQLLGELRQRFDTPIQMTDLFRYTTVESLARFLGDAPAEDNAAARGRARAQARQAMLTKRRSLGSS